jgi:glycosyltransferase involved in cell wall biosynthesis
LGQTGVTRVQAVLCVRDAINLLERCLQGLSNNGLEPADIIVVDGLSSDGSLELATRYGCTVLSDRGEGFSAARMLGINRCTSEFILILGPDDFLLSGAVEDAVRTMKSDSNLAGVQLGKTIDPALKGLLALGMRYYYSRLPPGPVRVIGNPSVYRGEQLKRHPYDLSFSANEDTDWCQRMERLGATFSRLQGTGAIEIEAFDWESFRARWRWYGQGDFRFVVKHWSLDRRSSIRHLFHPAREYFFRLGLGALLALKPREALFLFLCGYYRYVGFFAEMAGAFRSSQALRGR